MGGDDPTEDLALMAIFFEKFVKSVENYKIYGLIRGNLAKTPVWLDASMHPLLLSKTVYGEMDLKTPVILVAPPWRRSKFCTSSPEKESPLLVSYTGI